MVPPSPDEVCARERLSRSPTGCRRLQCFGLVDFHPCQLTERSLSKNSCFHAQCDHRSHQYRRNTTRTNAVYSWTF